MTDTQQTLLGEQPRLTRRQLEMLALLCKGKSQKQIAALLGLSYQTVKNTFYYARKRIEAENNTQIIHYAISQGLLKLYP